VSDTVSFETYWHGGKGAERRARGLSQAIEDAAHTLAYAVEAGAGGAEAPNHIYAHLGNLYSGASYLAEALDRMADRLAGMNRNGVLAHADDQDPGPDAAASIAALRQAASGARDLNLMLQNAQNKITHLKLTDQAGAKVWEKYGDED
jgi:hypothetical protein